MNQIFRKYADFIRQPDVTRLVLTALVARMPVGMVGFAMLMFLRESLGNFADAGLAVGAGFIAMAAAAPFQGRFIDRHGARRLLNVTGILQPLSLVALLFSARLQLPFAIVVACSVASGIFASPITTLTRTMWRNRFDREEDRRTAFALDSVTIEINFTAGPAIIAAVLAAWGATVAFTVAIAMVVIAFVVFMSSGVLRLMKRQSGTARRSLLGPLSDPGLLVTFVATFGLTLCFGMLEVGYPAFATALALPALGGVLLAINSLGSAFGGALYGGLHFKAPVERQFVWTMGLMAIPLALHAMVTGSPVAFAVVAFFAGMLIAPSIASQSVLVSRLAPAHYATEAFTWSSTFIVSGLGAGMALGGYLVETLGLAYAFATGSVVTALMALLALAIPARVRGPASASD